LEEEFDRHYTPTNPKDFFRSDLWRKTTAAGALGPGGEKLLVGLMRAAARNLIRQDPVAALVEFQIHHYQPFREFVEPLYWALIKSMDNPKTGYNPNDKTMRREFERLEKEKQQSEERKMSRSGDEMMLELAALMGTLEKTAAKKDDKKDDKADKEKEDKKEEKAEKEKKEKEDKKDKKDKKAEVMMHVVNNLVKLAGELDEIGAEEASSLVDDALRIIVKNIEAEQSE